MLYSHAWREHDRGAAELVIVLGSGVLLVGSRMRVSCGGRTTVRHCQDDACVVEDAVE
jgi:hypothetical protein